MKSASEGKLFALCVDLGPPAVQLRNFDLTILAAISRRRSVVNHLFFREAVPANPYPCSRKPRMNSNRHEWNWLPESVARCSSTHGLVNQFPCCRSGEMACLDSCGFVVVALNCLTRLPREPTAFTGRVQQRMERTFGAITRQEQATPFPRLSPFRPFGG